MSTNWPVAALAGMCHDVCYGYTANSTKEPDGPKFLRITDIVSHALSWDRVPYCEIQPDKFPRFALATCDIVVARTEATVGYAKYLTNRHRRSSSHISCSSV